MFGRCFIRKKFHEKFGGSFMPLAWDTNEQRLWNVDSETNYVIRRTLVCLNASASLDAIIYGTSVLMIE